MKKNVWVIFLSIKHTIQNQHSYISFSIPAICEDDTHTDASNEATSDQDGMNERDGLNLQNEDEDLSQEHTQNEYIGLDQETRCEDDNISRSSSEILYTLLHGIPR